MFVPLLEMRSFTLVHGCEAPDAAMRCALRIGLYQGCLWQCHLAVSRGLVGSYPMRCAVGIGGERPVGSAVPLGVHSVAWRSVA